MHGNGLQQMRGMLCVDGFVLSHKTLLEDAYAYDAAMPLGTV